MTSMNPYELISAELKKNNVTLVAVSKTKPIEEIKGLYDQGQRIFGENKVQELIEKQSLLPKDIEWHLIGHLQSNKVKYIAPFIAMIHSVDSLKLLFEINKEAQKNNRIIQVLIQIHIAQESTKFGADEKELIEILEYYCAENSSLQFIEIVGLMGMASNTDDATQVSNEFLHLKSLFNTVKKSYLLNKHSFNQLSMGMSSDYTLAIQAGSTMVRIGSLLFGKRD
ncbi:MAG: YggS family pyridoxal phosphate-dependent enzyme [Bacteroidetes bacterium]|jgi:pyridoxal phosphate enzyme (YggS family)|nr:YggS family pyridoxal phosphate-dependent enzyme [Bacteroidota bacterium]MBK7587220.1 YggS family pyridoxal phosphate-dependent enzyme [Bacteroidota bacterium]MBK8328254.1 YggS family pyridoxal phosphate-dependent enzyme [Bacteroidota bacterium]